MPLPDFVVVGTFKGATTGLATRLSEHPDVFMSPTKETHFFSDDALHSEGPERYRAFFADHAGERRIGEADPSYTRSRRYPEAAARMHALLPDAKLVYIVRDPIKRMESHWIEARRGGFPMPPFEESLRSAELDLISTSCYWSELEVLRRYYSDDRILILFTEDYRDRPDEVLERCYRFLDVDSTFVNARAGEVVRPSSGVFVDRPWVSRHVRGGPLNALLRLAPRPVLDALRPLARQRVTARPEWNRDTLEEVLETVRPDAHALLAHAGKPLDFWPSLSPDRG